MADKFVIAGGRGFLGGALARALAADGHDVILLSRRPAAPVGTIRTEVWDGRTLGPWAGALEGATALVNFAGRSIACLYTPEHRREIVASRVEAMRVLEQAGRGCLRPPAVWLQASAIAIYGDAGDRICDEAAPVAGDFLAEVCRTWEEAFFAAADGDGMRRVAVRIGYVLDPRGGALPPLAHLARVFLGGRAGSGRQYLSWVALDDFCALCRWLLDHPAARGIYNATAPAPATNAEFMRELRRALHRPWSPPAPAWAVRLAARHLLRVDPGLALTGRRCVPRRLLEEGFRFRHADLGATLRALYP